MLTSVIALFHIRCARRPGIELFLVIIARRNYWNRHYLDQNNVLNMNVNQRFFS